MKRYDYLQLMLGNKYQLEADDLILITSIVAILRDREIPVTFENAPLFPQLNGLDDHTERHQIYKVIAQGMAYWELSNSLQRVGSAWEAVKFLHDVMNGSGPVRLRKVAMVIVSEWHAALPQAEEAQVTDEAPAPENRKQHEGWMATGKFTVHEEDGEKVFDLTTNAKEKGSEPAVVTIARLLHAAWDHERSEVDPERLEKVALLLGQVLMGERAQLISQLEEARKATKPEPMSIWPKDQGHWIFDPVHSVLQPGLDIRKDHPSREKLETFVKRAAQFAMSRASGMGTTRVFNIEGFVNGVVLGLLGDGTAEHNFDIDEVFGRQEVHIPCNREHVEQVAETAEEPAGGESPAEVGK